MKAQCNSEGINNKSGTKNRNIVFGILYFFVVFSKKITLINNCMYIHKCLFSINN